AFFRPADVRGQNRQDFNVRHHDVTIIFVRLHELWLRNGIPDLLDEGCAESDEILCRGIVLEVSSSPGSHQLSFLGSSVERRARQRRANGAQHAKASNTSVGCRGWLSRFML